MSDEPTREMRLAVLIDADNASRSDMKAIVEEVAKYGTPSVRRAYGDWSLPRLAGWKDVLLDIGATAVQQHAYTKGKNATDAAMIIDAMDFLYAGNVDSFVLVSSDSDFTPLALRLREAGKRVYGIGERKTPPAFIRACDKFVYVDILREPEPPAPSAKASPAPKKTPSAKTIGFIAQTIAENAAEDGFCNLSALGSVLVKKRPDFDSRNYGYSQLSKLLRAIDRFDVKEKGGGLAVRDKAAKPDA